MSARRSVSRVLSHRRRSARWGWPSICGRRSPDGSCGLPEGWAAHLSPEPVARHGLRPPIWPCSRWSLPRFTPPADPKAGRRHRHCGTGPRLTTDGRYPPPCAEELGLSSRRPADRPDGPARPSDRLADRTGFYARIPPAGLQLRCGRVSGPPGRRTTEVGPAGRATPVDRLVGQRVRDRVLGTRHVVAPSSARSRRASAGPPSRAG